MKPKIIAIIPARGGSKGVPNKNIKLLGGKPLIAYGIEPALKSKYVDRTIVSTDSEKIAQAAKELGAEVIMRPSELAQDDTMDLPVFQHVINELEKEGYNPEFIVHLRCTTPFRKPQDIDVCIKKMFDTDASGVRTVNPVTENPYWMDRVVQGDILISFLPEGRTYKRRQDLPPIYRTNGIVDIVRKEIIMDGSMYAEDNQRAVITDPERSVEIDTEFDFFVCQAIIDQGKLEKWKI